MRNNRATGEAKDHMREIFKELRKEKFIARMNFRDCMSCASYALGKLLEEAPEKQYTAYWHNQDEQRYKRSGQLSLRYFGREKGDAEFAGLRIVEKLIERKAVFYWDGDQDRVIDVFDNLEVLKRELGEGRK